MPVGEVYAASWQSSGAQYPLTMPSDRGEQLRMLRDRFAARQTRCEPTLLKDAIHSSQYLAYWSWFRRFRMNPSGISISQARSRHSKR